MNTGNLSGTKNFKLSLRKFYTQIYFIQDNYIIMKLWECKIQF